MAGVFRIFSESENSFSSSLSQGKENSQIQSTSGLKSVGSARFPTAKILPQNKPKGLSIRSKSDLNVAISSKLGGVKMSSKDYLKLQPEKCLFGKQATSPMKITKTPKSKSLSNITAKKLSPKITSPIMQNVVDNFVFLKPKTPKKLPVCREPEKLSYYFDQYKYMNEEMELIFDEDRKLLRSARKNNDSIESFEDEGFISGTDDSFDISTMNVSTPPLSDVELPDISDSEDDSFDVHTDFHSALSSLSNIELPDLSD